MGRSTATQPVRDRSPRPSVSTSTAPGAGVREGHRDTIEAVVVALILALVVRGFEAQAFVIPTGSMAPTLMGRHKELACPQCGHVYSVNASDEIDTRFFSGDVVSGVCVNCRYQNNHLKDEPSFKGDRILVMMFPYDLPFLPGAKGPERWDVIVFRYPEGPEDSYIKRLVGLPGETLKVVQGDVYIRPPGGGPFQLQRKPLRHQTAMRLMVYDDRHRARALADRADWARWRGEAGWKEAAPNQGRYQIGADSAHGWSELRYHHIVPDPDQWDALLVDEAPATPPRATLITDFCSYNTNQMEGPQNQDHRVAPRRNDGAWKQIHWVGDLSMESTIVVKRAEGGGAVRFELIEGGTPCRCTIDLESGQAVFTRGEEVLGEGPTPLKGPGRYQARFDNIDNRLVLFVNGTAVAAPGFPYDPGSATPRPTNADLAPAAVAVRGAEAEVSDLVLKRDIYYTQSPTSSDYDELWDLDRPVGPNEVFDFLADPAHVPDLGRLNPREYEIGPDSYFMMGDNSPRSKDSRAWSTDDRAWDGSERQSWEVPRRMITGKAFYVYWPHGVPFGPDIRLGRDTRVIFRPYFERMKWIR